MAELRGETWCEASSQGQEQSWESHFCKTLFASRFSRHVTLFAARLYPRKTGCICRTVQRPYNGEIVFDVISAGQQRTCYSAFPSRERTASYLLSHQRLPRRFFSCLR